MKVYSDLPARRSAQLLTDAGVLVWVVLSVLMGRAVHAATMTLTAPGEQLVGAGDGLRGAMQRAAGAVTELPFVGDTVAAPFTSAAGVGGQLTDAGHAFVDAVGVLALTLGVVSAAVPIALVVLPWLVVRGRFARRATAAQRFIDGTPDLDLFALRAMARQPMQRLARVSDDPAGAWLRGDRAVIRELAEIELRACGLRPPPERVGG